MREAQPLEQGAQTLPESDREQAQEREKEVALGREQATTQQTLLLREGLTYAAAGNLQKARMRLRSVEELGEISEPADRPLYEELHRLLRLDPVAPALALALFLLWGWIVAATL